MLGEGVTVGADKCIDDIYSVTGDGVLPWADSWGMPAWEPDISSMCQSDKEQARLERIECPVTGRWL